MSTCLIDVIMHHKSGIPKDDNVNRWIVGNPAEADPAVVAAAACADLFTLFYNPVATFLAPVFDRGANHQEMKAYSLPGTALAGTTPLGSPVYSSTWTMPAPGSATGLPPEVACVVSYHGDLTGVPVESGTIRPGSRRHGRIYLGPLNLGMATTDGTTGETTMPTGAITTISNAAAAFLADSPLLWYVWSKAQAALFPVVGGWVDNGFDTQRRRGVDATVRHAW